MKLYLVTFATLLLLSPLAALYAADTMPGSQATQANNDLNEVYQYFVPGPANKNLGAYLWVPPEAKFIRGVMVGIHNGLPLTILQQPAVRRVCAENGIAQILMTPWSEDIGKVMLKDLSFDVTDPARTAVFDGYLKALAEASGHPELTVAPLIPLAHSAFASFPCEVAMRDPGRCLMAIPIKAGFPNAYDFFKAGGKSMKPAPHLNMAHVPILLCTSLNQSTVPGNWKTKSLPYGSGKGGHPFLYRNDKDDNAGDTYQPGNELCGLNWEMLSCHFDMSVREYEFIAMYLDAVCKLRLPATNPPSGTPTTLAPLTLSSGWLVDGFYSNCGQPGAKYYEPAPYNSYKGPKNRAYWYPTEDLARTMEQRMVREVTKKFEVFTLKDRKGEPISLAESPQVNLPEPADWIEKEGLITLRIHRYTTPPLICTNTDPKHMSDPASHRLENVLFPGKTELPISKRPMNVDLNGSALELVSNVGDEFTFRLRPHRLNPDPGGASGLCLRFYLQGDDEWAWSGRNVFSYWWLNGRKLPGLKDQTIKFAKPADITRTAKRINLSATASSGLPVGFFVREGPAIVQGDELVITQIPVADHRPIGITIGAYQTGLWQENGFRAADTIYQKCVLLP